MKIKLITLTAAAALTVAMAQENSDNVGLASTDNAPATEQAPAPAPATAPAPQVAPAPAAPAPQAATTAATDTATKKPTALHGISYNNVGNTAAESTVADNLNKPYKMAGSKFVYIEPTSAFSAVAFGDQSTKFISFEMSFSYSMTVKLSCTLNYRIELNIIR